MKLVGLVPSMALAWFGVGCSDSANCSAVGGVHTELYVVDSATGEAICNFSATLRAANSGAVVDGGAETSNDPNFCGFALVDAPAGDYWVSVTAQGYRDSALEIQVTIDECKARHIAPQGARDGLPGFGDTTTIGLSPE